MTVDTNPGKDNTTKTKPAEINAHSGLSYFYGSGDLGPPVSGRFVKGTGGSVPDERRTTPNS